MKKNVIYIPVKAEDATHIAKARTLGPYENDYIPVKPVEMPSESIKLAAYKIFMKALPKGRFKNINAEGYAEEVVEAITKLMKG